jgi:hypothetical protein
VIVLDYVQLGADGTLLALVVYNIVALKAIDRRFRDGG